MKKRLTGPMIRVGDANLQPAKTPHPGPVIVTSRRKPRSTLHAHLLEAMTPEEHRRRGDLAVALFRELVRRVREE
jgi:hypothetical protein